MTEDRARRTLFRFISYSFRFRRLMLLEVVLMAVTYLAYMAVPWLLGNAIDETLRHGIRWEQLQVAAIIVLLGVVQGTGGYFEAVVLGVVSVRSGEALRNDMFRKLLHLSFGYYDRQRTGDLMTRVTSDIDELQQYMAVMPLRVLSSSVILSVLAYFIAVTNWRLIVLAAIFTAVFVWMAMQRSGRLKDINAKLQSSRGAMAAILQENIAGMRVVKAFGAEEQEEGRFEREASHVAKFGFARDRFWATRTSMQLSISTVTMGAVIWFGGREIVAERLTIGELTTFVLYLDMWQKPAATVVALTLGLVGAMASGERVAEVLDARSPVAERPEAQELSNSRGHVRFENVTMSYGGIDTAIRDVDFEVQPGQLVALLGAPGSGKTTIVHLLPRFYDVSSGRVTIDGADVRELTLSSLRRNVGIALQDEFVFGATFRENILYGAEGVTDDDMVRAAKIAQLHDFILSLPDGYDMWVGERGVKLSGGQRQRLAIARTILLDPPILVLDDSTSSVDMETEYKIQQALEEVVKGRTTFVIAHRLSTVRNADLILVMDQGRMVERGSHEELRALGGLYGHIYDLQLAPTVDDAMGQIPEPVREIV